MIDGVKTVAICVSELHNEDIQDMLYPLCQYLKQQGCSILLFSTCTQLLTNNPFDRGEAGIYRFIPYDEVDVVLIFSHVLKDKDVVQRIVEQSNAHSVPIVVYNLEEKIEGAVNISFEEGDAFRDLVTHLIEQHGVRRLKCIAGIPENIGSQGRLQVLREVLSEHGISFDEETDLGYGYFYEHPTRMVMKRFLEDEKGLPDAIVCLNDSMAMEAIRILTSRGVRVPEDVIVTGFDGTVQERYFMPRLCTCKRNMQGMAKAVADIILNPDRTLYENDMAYIPYIFTPSTSCGCEQAANINDVINVSELFQKDFYINRRDGDMTYMMSMLSVITQPEELAETLEFYTNTDTYICTYQESDQDQAKAKKLFGTEEREMRCRYFPYEEAAKSSDRGLFRATALFPGVEKCVTDQQLLIYFSIHGEDRVVGYVAMVVDDSSYMSFGSSLTMNQKLASSLDNAVSARLMQQELKTANEILYRIQNKIISGFSELVESRDDFTGQHIKRTSEYIRVLCRHLMNKEKYRDFLTEEMIDLIYKAAPLHDVGKIKVSDVILNKPGRLTPEEFEYIKKHTTEGYNIIRTLMTEVEDEAYIELAQDVALYHHEKWDGTGYPVGLKGEEIPLPARLMAIVDVFDALSSKRVYKDAYSLDETFHIIEESSGSHFDPDVVNAFMEVKDEIVETFRKITI